MRINYLIILVSDMERSLAFYRDIVGMAPRFDSPGWTEFDTEGATWALHKSDGPAPGAEALQSETAGRCRPGFQVPDLDVFHQRMLENDVTCAQDPTETFGVRIAQYVDPDGLLFSVSEAKRDA